MSPRQVALGGLAGLPPVAQDPGVIVPANVPLSHLPRTTRTLVCVPPLGRAQPRMVVHATGLGKNSKILAQRGNP